MWTLPEEKQLLPGSVVTLRIFRPEEGLSPGAHIDVIQSYESMVRIREAADILIPIHALEIGRKKSIPD